MKKEGKTVKAKTAKKVAKISKEVAIPKEKKVDMNWAAATNVANMGREDISAAPAKKMVMLASKVFELPIQGLTILGGQPYINKVGWNIKRYQKLAGSRFTTTWHHLAIPDEKYAIVEVKLLDKAGIEIGSAIGEADEKNIKLAAVKLTLNMMAETRAKNRAMSDALTGMVFVEAVEKMNVMISEQKMTEHEAAQVAEAARTSADELGEVGTEVKPHMVQPDQVAPQGNGAPKDAETTSTSFIDQVKIELTKAGAINEWSAIEKLNDMAGIQVNHIAELTEGQAQVALAKIKMYNSNKK